VFWERLTHNEQDRYWSLSQRLKRYVTACLQFPGVEKAMIEWLKAAHEEREAICRREERKSNHFTHNVANHVHYDQETIRMHLELELNFCRDHMVNSVCTDAELIEIELLACKGWGI
jgi:hypothetical protein